VEKLLASARPVTGASSRIDIVSAQFIGLPYRPFPLIGSAESPEVLTVSTNGFDCVTYIETVLALSRSESLPEFIDTLRRIRYDSGRIDWRRRNHYMTEWIRNNIRYGCVRRISGLRNGVEKDRVLDVVPGLAVRRSRFNCVPKRELLRVSSKLRTGDLVFFASTRKNLDVFHCGVLVNNGMGLLMRHASRGRGAVVEQNLPEFLKQNRMAGVIVVRPTESN